MSRRRPTPEQRIARAAAEELAAIRREEAERAIRDGLWGQIGECETLDDLKTVLQALVRHLGIIDRVY